MLISATLSGISPGTSLPILTGPRAGGRRGQLDYLEERGAIPEAIETLERAWTQYEAYRGAHPDA